MQINIPDPQHAMLDALMSEVYRLQDEGEDLSWAFDGEPESVVFYGEDLDRDFVDMDEAMDTIRLVGERDLQAKIDHWTGILQNLKDARAEEQSQE